ncbi:C-C chemokine receptor type 5 [Scophthalmus maximus]|nr:C-C chemokine receptor type 5 [Scophthalmus maximus]
MSDTGINHTFSTTFDYSAFYEETYINYTPTNVVDLKNFGSVFLPTLYTLVFIVGFVGNGIVVCVLVTHRSQTNLTDICLFNLALSDLLFLLTLPFYAHFAAVARWTFGDFMCRFVSLCYLAGFFSSIFFMVVMTLDRYLVIVHTHRVARHRTKRAAAVLSSCVWLLSVCVSLPAFVFTGVTDESHGPKCAYAPDNAAWELYTLCATNALGLVIPLLVMVVCYSRIVPTLLTMRSAKRHRVVKLIVSIVVAFFLFWVPYNISIVLHMLQSLGKLSDDCRLRANINLSVTLTETFAYSHCCLNPIIYAFVGQKFKTRAVQLLRRWAPATRSARDLLDGYLRKNSVVSRSSDVTSSFVM